jgi:hypothetical protein
MKNTVKNSCTSEHFFILTLLTLAGAVSACSKQSSGSGSPSFQIAADKSGYPILSYSGPGIYQYSSSFGSFTFQIGPSLSGTPWIKIKGEMKVGDSNDVVIQIQSSSDRTYDLQFLGLSTNSGDIPEEKTQETVRVGPGDQKLSFPRFIIYTYKPNH